MCQSNNPYEGLSWAMRNSPSSFTAGTFELDTRTELRRLPRSSSGKMQCHTIKLTLRKRGVREWTLRVNSANSSQHHFRSYFRYQARSSEPVAGPRSGAFFAACIISVISLLQNLWGSRLLSALQPIMAHYELLADPGWLLRGPRIMISY